MAEDRKVYGKSLRKFGLELLNECFSTGENTFISPFSISIALQMLSLGTNGETKRELLDVLGLEDCDFAPNIKQIIDSFNSRSDVTISIANSIWANSDEVEFNENLKAELSQSFYSAIEAEDFGNPATVKKINRWVKDSTGGKIPTLIKELCPSTLAIILNAIYFKGTWKEEFDSSKNRQGKFKLSNGDSKSVTYMRTTGEFACGYSGDCKILRLPYLDRGATNLWLALPKERYMYEDNQDRNIEQVLRTLNSSFIHAWRRDAKKVSTPVLMPKFKIESEYKLKDYLEHLGVKKIFNDGDLSKLFKGDAPSAIQSVTHKVVFEVNEKGTEAAAATMVEITRGGPPFSFECDQPFIAVIHDEPTDTVLFMGVVSDPDSAE